MHAIRANASMHVLTRPRAAVASVPWRSPIRTPHKHVRAVRACAFGSSATVRSMERARSCRNGHMIHHIPRRRRAKS
eukprot:3169151-Pleurochrysis_carterae.AAC.2